MYMRALMPFVVLLLSGLAIDLDAQQQTVCAPELTATGEVSRWLPYGYYDQAEQSLAVLFPQRVVLAARRLGRLGQLEYALIVYRRTPADSARFTGLAVSWHDERAWQIDGVCSPEAWPEGLLNTLEALTQVSAPPAD